MVVMLGIILALYLIVRTCVKKTPQKHGKWLLTSVFLAMIGIYILFSQINAYRNVVLAYQQGKFLIVTGNVQNYMAPSSTLNKYESFSVSGISFSYGGSEGKNYFGYDKTILDGGSINGNGVFVTVYYIIYDDKDDKNVIVRLDVE